MNARNEDVSSLPPEDPESMEELSLLKAEITQLKAQLADERRHSALLREQNEILEDERRLANAHADQKVKRVSHEVQVRLQGIIAETENLIYAIPGLDPRGATERLQLVLYSALAMDTVTQTLIGDYLEEFYFTEEPVMLLLYEAKQTFHEMALRKGVEIEVRLDSEASLPPIEMFKPHMQQAFNNLVHNAVKYSFRGALDRYRFIRIEGRIDGDDYILAFENYGVGIEDDEKEKVFDEGYQGRLTRGEHRTGAGLGLALTKRVIERHHGQVTVESKLMTDPTLGGAKNPHLTRFTVRLPRQQPSGER